MAKIRVLLALSRVEGLSLLKETLRQAPDMEIVGEAGDPVGILLEAGAARAQVVAIELPPSGEESGLCSHLLAEYPQLRIIAVSGEGNFAVMYKTGIVRRRIPDTSPEDIVKLIRWSMINTDTGWEDTEPLPG